MLIMEDLLWVLTDDQLKAALHFADSLTGLLKRATEESQKTKGARKLEVIKMLLYFKAFEGHEKGPWKENNHEIECVKSI